MTFGERLRDCREYRSMTQTDLDKTVGVSPASIWYYEHNEVDPSLFTASCIATALGVSIDYLAGLSKQKCIK